MKNYLNSLFLSSTLLIAMVSQAVLAANDLCDQMLGLQMDSVHTSVTDQFWRRMRTANFIGTGLYEKSKGLDLPGVDALLNSDPELANPNSFAHVVHRGYAELWDFNNKKTVWVEKRNNRTYLKRTGPTWASGWQLRNNAYQGNLMGVIEVLGKELCEFLGIHVIDATTVDVTDFINQEFIDKRVELLKQKTGRYFPRIRIVNGDIPTREFIENFEKKEISISADGDIFIHDFTYHLMQFFLGDYYWQLMSAHAHNSLLLIDIANSIKFFDLKYSDLKLYFHGFGVFQNQNGLLEVKKNLDQLGLFYDGLTGNLRNLGNSRYSAEMLELALQELIYNLHFGVNTPFSLDPTDYSQILNPNFKVYIAHIKKLYLQHPKRIYIENAPLHELYPDEKPQAIWDYKNPARGLMNSMIHTLESARSAVQK